MNIYISIGTQCSTSTLFKRLGVKKESLPFDWMFSTPEFVYTIIKLLLIDKLEIEDIIDNHFFLCDKKAYLQSKGNCILSDKGSVLVNSKYNVCFPHDKLTDREKYIRRMYRLKELLLNTDNFIYFVYVSVSSPSIGNYTINGLKPIQDLYNYTEKLNDIIKTVRDNYKIIIFNTDDSSDINNSDKTHMSYYYIKKKNNWKNMIPELINKCTNLIDTNVIQR